MSDADPAHDRPAWRRWLTRASGWLPAGTVDAATALMRGPYRQWVWAGLTAAAVAAVAGGGLLAYLIANSVKPLVPVGPVYPYSTAATRPPGRLRVLFLGNSFTQFNGGVALTLRELAASAGKEPPPVFDQVTRFGATWAELWGQTAAVETIRQGNWDYVVLQDYSRAATLYRSEMDQYGHTFANEIRAAGAQPIYFMTWARQDEPKTQRLITGAYATVAAANHAAVAPVGVAWAASLHGRPRLTLHIPDKKHPTPAGTYLTGCVFYAVLYGQSPHGLTPRVADGTTAYIDLPEADATYLQDVAWATVKGAGRSASTRPAATRPATAPTSAPTVPRAT